jgi:type II secretory pathway pseudopilin PulG
MSRLESSSGFSLVDLLIALAIFGAVAGIALPVTSSAIAAQRFKGDSQALTQVVSLAKMRASAGFTRARVRVDLTANSYTLEVWNKNTDAWIAEGAEVRTSLGVTFGFGSLITPPPDTQVSIGMSPECRVGVLAGSTAIGNTACIVFNSRGLPVDGDGILFGGHALYLTNGSVVAATTITSTPRIRRWESRTASASWKEQQ